MTTQATTPVQDTDVRHATVGPLTATAHLPESAGRHVYEITPTPYGVRVLFGDATGPDPAHEADAADTPPRSAC